MKHFVIAPAVAALAMFFWGFIYYGISGLPYRALQPSENLAAALSALPSDGTYLFPDPRAGDEAMAEAMKTGPVAMVHLRKQPQSMGSVMAKGYLHEFVACLLLAVLLVKAAPALNSYCCRVGFTVLVGLVGTWFTNGGAAVWWQQPWMWHLTTMFYDVIAWLVAGLVLAKFFTPRAPAQV